MDAYSLYQVNEFIKRSIALNFPAAIWIQAEIGQVRQSRGHWFIELVEKGEAKDEIIAQASAVIWSGKYQQIKRKVGKDLDAILEDGMEVMLQCNINFHERYGLKFSIVDVQAEYTLGKLAKERAATIAELKKLNLIGGNARVAAAPVLQRIAVISSSTAAGYQDFIEHLKNNPFGYRFFIDLYPAAMQGPQLEPENLEALSRIHAEGGYDAVVLIRGGGSRLDLMGFDSLLLSKAIAQFSIPVLTGIGHDIDEAVVDLVAFKALKTPTAVAEYLVHYNAHFEEDLLEQIQLIQGEAELCIQKAKDDVLHWEQFIQVKVPALLADQKHMLAQNLNFFTREIPLMLREENQRLLFQEKRLMPAASRILETTKLKLERKIREVELLSPDKILARGFSINLINGKSLGPGNIPVEGDEMLTLSRVGKITSKVEKYEQKNT